MVGNLISIRRVKLMVWLCVVKLGEDFIINEFYSTIKIYINSTIWMSVYSNIIKK